jgi:hypothetical protein
MLNGLTTQTHERKRFVLLPATTFSSYNYVGGKRIFCLSNTTTYKNVYWYV